MGVEVFDLARKEGRNFLNVFESLQLIKEYGIPTPEFRFVRSLEEALKASEGLRFPLVLKVCSSDIVHKSDVGGVALNLESKEELEKAFKEMERKVRERVANARIDGFLLQEMIEDGQFLIIGGKKDSQFGQTIMFGFGGIYAEIFKDVSFRIVPIDEKEARKMVEETKVFQVLKGYRGKKYDLEAVIDILLKTSKLLEELDLIKELDINPLIVLEKGAFAVDARVVFE